MRSPSGARAATRFALPGHGRKEDRWERSSGGSDLSGDNKNSDGVRVHAVCGLTPKHSRKSLNPVLGPCFKTGGCPRLIEPSL